MSLRKALLPVVNTIRGLAGPQTLDIRPYTVTVRTRTWSGGVVQKGTPTDQDLELTPPPKVVEEGRDVRVDHAPRLVTNSADAAVQYAAAGGGLTRVLAYQAADALRRGRLKVVLQKFEVPRLPISMVYPTSRLLSAKVRTFIDLVTEIADWRFG